MHHNNSTRPFGQDIKNYVSTVLIGATLLVAPLAIATTVHAEDMAITDANRAQVETIVKDYLLKNPEILIEMNTALEKKQFELKREQAANALSSSSDDIFTSKSDGIVGNPEGDVTIVEFFDYNCGYCRRAFADLEALVENDGNLRFVLKEFPILGPDSQGAHMVSMAFHAMMPEKYGDLHHKLMTHKGRINEQVAMEAAIELGADEAKLREEMKNPAILEIFENTQRLADKLAITGTPSYVVGDEVMSGALGNEVLAKKIENFRTCKSTVCS